jgi:hypothetical protein
MDQVTIIRQGRAQANDTQTMIQAAPAAAAMVKAEAASRKQR